MLIIPANSLSSGGYSVDNSCRFNGTNDSLVRTPSSAGSSTINTWSFWIKRTDLDDYETLYSSEISSSNVFKIGFTLNTLEILFYVAPSYIFQIKTNRLFRDISAWYNIVIIQNAGAGTNTDRLQIWVNGIRETSFSITNFPDLDEGAAPINATTAAQNIGTTGTENFGGYMSEVVHIDGTAYAASDFGEFDEDSGIWKPIDVSGLTFGTNGFYLDFEDSAALGDDVSGNGNDFTENNLTAVDQATDTPTNNFATLNSLKFIGGTFSEGNLKFTGIASNWKNRYSTIGVSSGKWFMEFKMGSITDDQSGVAIVSDLTPDGNFPGVDSTRVPAIAYNSDGNKYVNNSASSGYFSAMSTNDIIGIALDMDNGTVQFYLNGSTTGSAIDLSDAFSTSQYPLFFCGAVYNTRDLQANFGSPPYTISSGNADGNSRGNFEYSVPSGFLSLCTKNLSEILS